MKKIFPGCLIQYNDCNIFYLVIYSSRTKIHILRICMPIKQLEFRQLHSNIEYLNILK